MSDHFVLIDNYDSFTYNLFHYLGELGVRVDVHRNDAIGVDALIAAAPAGIVISPGPGTPDESGISQEILRRMAETTPIFGVCLGHQTIGQHFGGEVIRGPEPVHGKTSMITHRGSDVFADIPSPLKVTRYHSLIVAKDGLPDCLEVTAETDDGIIMGLAHKQLPIFGVQFHPESIESDHGHDLLQNFVSLAGQRQAA